MANYLQMSKKQQVLALLELGWSHRRIQRESGVDRGPGMIVRRGVSVKNW